MIRKPKTAKKSKAEIPEGCYQASNGNILNPAQTDAFEQFWKAFNYPRSKAEAASSWYRLRVTPKLLASILEGAAREASARPAMVEDGRAPKMAQGWLSSRRWEDGAVGNETLKLWHETGPGIEAKGKEYGIEQGDLEPAYWYQKIKAEARNRGEL